MWKHANFAPLPQQVPDFITDFFSSRAQQEYQ